MLVNGTVYVPINPPLAQITHGDVGALGASPTFPSATAVDTIRAGCQGVEEFHRHPLRLKSATGFREWLADQDCRFGALVSGQEGGIDKALARPPNRQAIDGPIC
jgi:hypothetical protein